MDPQVLIVEDSLTVRMDLSEAFAEVGFVPAAVGDLCEARLVLEKGPPALIVLDVLLPDGDGVDFLHEIRAEPSTASVPVLLLSSETEVGDRVRGLEGGANEYIGKPYDREYLIARARELAGDAARAQAVDHPPLVLVIDDSRSVREELRAALQDRSYAVETVDNAEEGLRLAVRSRPSAIVVDCQLPGIDGATFVRRLRSDSALRDTPCLLLTASEERETEASSWEAGADAFTRKSEGIDVIVARLGAMLRSAADEPSRHPESSLFGPKRILAVDDSMTYLQSLIATLQAEQYDVIPARSGVEALKLLALQSVDCVLLDLVMPGLSGEETCRQIKQAPGWRGIPVIMLTAHDDRETVINGFNAGADDFVCKSSEFELLGARLRAQLRRKQHEDENRRIHEEILLKEAEAAEASDLRELAEARARHLRELEKANKELDAFSYSVSHDLRAPLRAIDGFTRIVLEQFGPGLPEEARQHLLCVRDNVRQMSQLIEDLLNLSRTQRQTLRKQTVDLSSLVRQILSELLAGCEGRRVETIVGDIGSCEADPNLLKQVLINLISNALKFTRKREQAIIEIGIDRVPRAAGSATVYFVRDNGAGFNMKYAEKLFGVFQRLHTAEDFEGTGVGLALSRRIVERHGGHIWAEAEPEQGATFFFTLEEIELPTVEIPTFASRNEFERQKTTV